MKRHELAGKALILGPLLCLIPWLFLQMQTSLDTNHAFLMIGMERLLDGGRFVSEYYDPNPPLSNLIYLPAIAMHRWLGIPSYYTPYIFGVICLALSALATWKLLRLWSELDYPRRAVILSSFLAASTYLPGTFYFAERDALVVWGLFPFMLAQLALTRGDKISPRLLYPVLILGAWAVLIKPHYGLFPVLLLLHRTIRRKKVFSIVKDPDFAALALSTTAYGIILLVFFRPYLDTVLPELLNIYIVYQNPSVPLWWQMFTGLIVTVAFTAALADIPKERKKPIYLFLLAGFLCSCLYLMQMKGFHYHLIPLMVFSWCGTGLFVHALFRRYAGESPLADLAAVLSVMLFATLVAPQRGNAVTHGDYRDLNLARLVRNCAPDCSFFVISENMEMIHQVTIYTGAPHASRYAGLWWFRPLYQSGQQERLDRHIDSVAEDLRRYKPAVMAVLTNSPVGEEENFDFIGYMSRNPAFREEMSHYRKMGALKDNRRDYFRKTALDYDFPLVYDVYERIGDDHGTP